MSYNGWKNYETWLTNLWLTNDQCAVEHYLEVCEAFDYDVRDVAHQLEGEFDAELGDTTGWRGDLIRSAFQEIDWEEIAQSLVESAQEAAM